MEEHETSDKKQKFKRRGLCSVFTYKGTQNIDKFNTRSPPQAVSVHKQEKLDIDKLTRSAR